MGSIEPFLRSLERQETAGFSLEAIVADGDSDDGTRQLLEAYSRKQPWLTVVSNPARSVSSGLNLAINASRGDVLARMDVHTEYAGDYLRSCLSVLNAVGAENVGGAARTKARGWVAEAISAAYSSSFSCGGARFHDPSYEGYVDTVTYGCWRRSTLERLGGFDENLVRNQDDELNLRLIRSGGKIYQSRSIVSWYRPRSTLRNLFKQYLQYGFWKVRVIAKHGSPASNRHLAPGLFVLTSLVLILSWAVFAAADLTEGVRFTQAGGLSLWGSYSAAVLLASVAAARKCGWKLLPILPLVFATYHLGYGLGFLAGLIDAQTLRKGSAGFGTRFSSLSR